MRIDLNRNPYAPEFPHFNDFTSAHHIKPTMSRMVSPVLSYGTRPRFLSVPFTILMPCHMCTDCNRIPYVPDIPHFNDSPYKIY
jgi:hypothetical protein